MRAGILFFLTFLVLERYSGKEPAPGKAAVPDRKEAQETEELTNDSGKYHSPVPFEQLWKINPDIIGWIFIDGTNINNPVLQAEDNTKYLTAGYDGAENPAGAVFLDYECERNFSRQHNILYGHNMKDGSMFHDLVNFKKKSYYRSHQNITVYDPAEYDEVSGSLYGLDDWGDRICMLDSETGMAYVEDEKGNIIVWPLDNNGNKIISQSVEVHRDENGKETINSDLEPVVDENGLPIYYKNGGVTMADNEWVTSEEKQAHEIARVPAGAYILEETVVPSSKGYVQTMPIGMVVNEITRDLEGNPRIQNQWISGYAYDDRGNLKLDGNNNPLKTTKPHWIDHIAPGDYILRETRTPTEAGYVTSSDVEVTILENGEVQGAVMEDDHTAVEILKTDSRTGKALGNENPAVLALYPAVLGEKGEPEYDENGQIRYNPEKPFYRWTTDDGSEVRKTAHLVETEGGHSYIAYDYDIKPVPGSVQTMCYVTETGAMHFDYMPVGKYVLAEDSVPSGMKKADPVLDVGSETRTQNFTMINEPITVLFLKTSVPGGKVIAGARLAVYRAAEDGSLTKHNRYDEEGNQLFITDTDGNFIYDKDRNLIPSVDYEESDLVETWISGSDGVYTEQEQKEGQIPDGFAAGDLKPHKIEALPQGIYYLVEQQTPFGYVRAEEIRFESVESSIVIEIEMVDKSIKGRLEITKTDAEKPDKPLAGAVFKVTNADKNTATILITDKNGYVGSRCRPLLSETIRFR